MSISPSFISRTNMVEYIKFNKDASVIKNVDNWSIDFDLNYSINGNSSLSFISETKKIVVRILPSFFHFYTEQFATLLLASSIYKDIEVVVIDAYDAKSFGNMPDLNKAIDMFFLFLRDSNLKHTVVKIKDVDGIRINNYFLCDDMIDDSRNQAMILSDLSSPYVFNKEKQNKVYIRSNRVKNEPLLEEYLIGYGFVIIKKDSFNTFTEQMNYYYNSKLVISATCGGLVNSCFMKETSSVIELVTPVDQFFDKEGNISSHHREDIHHIYNTLCFQKNMYYFAIQNYKKDAYDIISKLENNKAIKLMMES